MAPALVASAEDLDVCFVVLGVVGGRDAWLGHGGGHCAWNQPLVASVEDIDMCSVVLGVVGGRDARLGHGGGRCAWNQP